MYTFKAMPVKVSTYIVDNNKGIWEKNCNEIVLKAS